MVFCRGCGKEIHDSAPVCPGCGAVQIQQQGRPASASDKRILPAFLLCFFFGIFGAHRFYAGKIGTAVAQLLTIGGLGVWTLVDLILLVCGAFTDGAGNRMTAWT
jgi:TM2 domain-containing membrane protein YozV